MSPDYLSSDPLDTFNFGEHGFVRVEYDSRRHLWWFNGLGFDFAAYFVGPYLQADVSRADDGPDGCVLGLSIALGPAENITAVVFASKCLQELARYWDVFGELGDDTQ